MKRTKKYELLCKLQQYILAREKRRQKNFTSDWCEGFSQGTQFTVGLISKFRDRKPRGKKK